MAQPDDPKQPDPDAERAMREAEARALAESGLGSGLLARRSVPSGETAAAVPVLKICPQCGREYETTSRFCPEDGTALRPKGSDSLVGCTLAERYHILKRIGEGGMGRVYLGEHVKMNRQCAIKVMSPSLVNDAESAARFAREASNAARIIHPNVAAVFDFGESEGVVYLVMEYVEGEPLSRILAREAPLSLPRAVELTRQIADGLGAAHELGIIHRDLKPDNILVMRTKSGKEVAKVVDFGIAKAMQEGVNEGLTRTGQVIGTPEFMSPEQLYGDHVDARADLYALGCILHLMLTGQSPFDAPTREQMIKRRLAEDPDSVHAIDPGIPDVVANVVARLLARSPNERYGSAAEVRDALDGNLARRSGFEMRAPLANRYTPRSAPTVAFLQATEATTEITEVPPLPPPTRRSPYVIGGAAVIAAALAGLYLRPPSSTATKSEEAQLVPKDTATAPMSTAVAPPIAVADSAKLKQDSAKAALSAAAKTPPLAASSFQDSVRKAARLAKQKAAADSAPARPREVAADTTGIMRAVNRYTKALESGSIAALKVVYPTMSQKEQDSWERGYFDRMDKIDTHLSGFSAKIAGDSADADYALKLSYIDKSTKQQSEILLRQRARLVKHGAGWEIVSFTLR